jgi:ATP adenylyltransferase
LQVELLGSSHVVLLNKFPVQEAHLLLISQQWMPQAGWLSPTDWQAVAHVAADTDGLWFFNSAAASGASQPHRHLQLLPRHPDEPSCPLDGHLEQQLAGSSRPWPWHYAISRRVDPSGHGDLEQLYNDHASQLGLGDPDQLPQPLYPYNLLFNDRWFVTIRRVREHCAGFSLNALGFAGYLLATEQSDLGWLDQNGAWALLGQVAAPAVPKPGS